MLAFFFIFVSLFSHFSLNFLNLITIYIGAWLLIPHDMNVNDIPNNNNNALRTIKVNYDSIWTRDYGPVGGTIVEQPDSRSRAIVNAVYGLADSRVYDDDVPCHMANSFRRKLPCHSTSIIMDGGNLMFDGIGGLFTTSITYDWNNHLSKQQVDNELKAAYGVDYIYSIEYAKIGNSRQPADGTGHLDMFVKILAPCVVIVAEAPINNRAYYSVLNQAATFFSSLTCQNNNGSSSKYQVYRVPGWDQDGVWYTYTNSLIVNDRVIVPSYSSTNNAKDNQALAMYNTAAPHLTVDFVNSDYIINFGGAVHCMTKEIPRLTKRRQQ